MKIIYTYGAFDLLHPGHIKLLQRAKDLGDYLIVGIAGDESIKKLKGNDRPIQNQKDRAFIVESLDMVDEVMLQEEYDPSVNLKQLANDNKSVSILAKGDDWTYIPGTETIEELGGILVKLSYSKGFSTSEMVKKIRGSHDSNLK
jgi:D-beta-D-heptose 7-phosphate kinase/D-beta-D-heptose 1-phosphate adenosyltransferase